MSRPAWLPVAALGLVTCTAYGSWFYGFGVLIDPINADTGWSRTSLGVIYGGAQLLTGVGATLGGRLLDRHGTWVPMTLQAVVGGGLMLAAASASSPWVFGSLYTLGAGATGAFAFYHVTTSAAARLRPDAPDRAIAQLTIIGAFASPVYLPVTAWLVEQHDWRTVARILALAAIAGALLAAALSPGGRTPAGSSPTPNPLAAISVALRQPLVRRMLGSYLAAGLAYASVLVYQVPILTAAGLSLGTAGLIGGLRGGCQVFGRIGLVGPIARIGAGRLLRAAYLVAALGIACLLLGNLAGGLVFAVLAGASLGAVTPLQAVYSRAHFEPRDLGLLMGVQALATGLAGALGPTVGGILRDSTGTWNYSVVLAIGGLLAAAVLLKPGRDAPRPDVPTASAR